MGMTDDIVRGRVLTLLSDLELVCGKESNVSSENGKEGA